MYHCAGTTLVYWWWTRTYFSVLKLLVWSRLPPKMWLESLHHIYFIYRIVLFHQRNPWHAFTLTCIFSTGKTNAANDSALYDFNKFSGYIGIKVFISCNCVSLFVSACYSLYVNIQALWVNVHVLQVLHI